MRRLGNKVAARNLTASDVVAALRAANVQVPAGALNQPPAKSNEAFQLARTPATPSMPPAMLSGTRLFFALGGAEDAVSDARNASDQPVSGGLFVPLTVPPGGKR